MAKLARDGLLREVVEIVSTDRPFARTRLSRPEPDVLAAVERHRLGGLFYEAVREPTKHRLFSDEALDRLRDRTRQIAAVAMLQEQAALLAEESFRQADIPRVFYKAAHLRRLLYASRTHRPADDVDVLVRSTDHNAAWDALLRAGFVSVPKHSPITHEATLSWHGAHIDLHWALFRPGRARVDITNEVIASGGPLKGLPVPSIEHELVILLVGTAFGDYVTSRLIRAVDIDRLIRQASPRWDVVLQLVERMGLRTAAWATLTWTCSWFDTPVPGEVWRQLAPGRLRRAYLRAWLERDPWRVYMQSPTFARFGFSLALQDRGAGMVRSVIQRLLARHRGN